MSDPLLEYWNNNQVESMYDKNLLAVEIEAVSEFLEQKDEVLDIGCGEGEGTAVYSKLVKQITALDFSETRLKKLKGENPNIRTIQMDMRSLTPENPGGRFNTIITQRSLINLKDFEEQKQVIRAIHSILEKQGKYILLEGFSEGTESLNRMRKDFLLPSIEVRWHNCFFNRSELELFLEPYFEIEQQRDFSLYFFLTRVVNAITKHPKNPEWNDPLNMLAAKMEKKYKNSFLQGLSRLEIWVLRKK